MDAGTAYSYLRSKFVMAKPAHKLIKQFDLKFKYGKFNKKEAEICNVSIEEFLKERNLTMDDLQYHLAEESPFPFLALVSHAVEKLRHRTYKAVHTHIAFTYHPLITHKFSGEDDIELIRLVQQRGFQWKEIGQRLEKYRNHCRIRYLSLRGEKRAYVSYRQIKNMLQNGLPKTEEEWRACACELGVQKETLIKRVTRYLRSMLFDRNEESYTVIVICAYALAYNYFCAMNLDVKGLLSFLKGSCGDVIVGRPKSDEECVRQHGEVRAYFEDQFESYIKDNVDLDVKIQSVDVFWDTIGRELLLVPLNLETRFNVILKSYSLTTFKDLFLFFKEQSFGYYLSGIKSQLLENTTN